MHTVFAIFDDNGDGLLSYQEFIAIMKDRLHRGFKVSIVCNFLEFIFEILLFQSYAKNEGWEAFKMCVKQEMKTPS